MMRALPGSSVRADRRAPRLEGHTYARRAVQAALNLGSHAHLLSPSHRRIAYVGWAGHENAGDEAILVACRLALRDHALARVSVRTPFARLDRLTPWDLFRAVLLGGGTLIGLPGYRSVLTTLLERHENLPAFTLGAGVEDPQFFGVNQVTVETLRRANPGAPEDMLPGAELNRWAPVLRRFHRVTVRGPRSRDVLEQAGIEAEIVGDPALLMAGEAPSDRFHERRLGVNIGISPGLWGGDPSGLLRTVVEFARTMQARGWKIVFFPVWPADVPYIREAARRIGGETEVFPDFLDLEKLFAAIRECHVFVGQKLHSVVFASAVYVPSVMLEYHPKCADFQDSLGRSRYTIRTDQVTSDSLLAAVEELADSRDAHQAALFGSVGQLRARLEAEAAYIRRELAKDPDEIRRPLGKPVA